MPAQRKKFIDVQVESPTLSALINQESAPEEQYLVTLVIDPQNAIDESRIGLKLPESTIRGLLAGRLPFIPLPQRYAKFLGIHDSGEAVFLAANMIHQIRIRGWPEPMPEE